MSEMSDELMRNTRRLIHQFGWAVQGVGDGAGSWTYTIGLREIGKPELIMVGVDFISAQRVMNQAGRASRDGVDIAHPVELAQAFGHARPFLHLRAVHPSWYRTDLFNVARRYYGESGSYTQVVVADSEGRFPWDAGHGLATDQHALWEPYPGGWPDE